jgi:hypothetical protein
VTESIQKIDTRRSVPNWGKIAVTLHTAPCDAPEVEAVDLGEPADIDDIDDLDGWQALAVAALDRLLTGTELAAAERLPTELALDLLFPDLPDAARQEALWALA